MTPWQLRNERFSDNEQGTEISGSDKRTHKTKRQTIKHDMIHYRFQAYRDNHYDVVGLPPCFCLSEEMDSVEAGSCACADTPYPEGWSPSGRDRFSCENRRLTRVSLSGVFAPRHRRPLRWHRRPLTQNPDSSCATGPHAGFLQTTGPPSASPCLYAHPGMSRLQALNSPLYVWILCRGCDR